MKYLRKIIEIGLYLLVFLLPWQTRLILKTGSINGGYSEYLTFSLYGIDILLILVLSFFITLRLKEKRVPASVPLIWWLLAGLEFTIFISIFIAPNKLLAFYFYLKFLLSLGLFWLITTASYNKIKLLYSFLTGVFLQAVLGIWQFLSQGSLAFKWLGLSHHDPAALGAAVVETPAGVRWLRAYGGLDHPNMLGGLLTISILILLISIVSIKTEANSEKYKAKKYLDYFLFITFLVTLFFTFSRGAWVGLLVGIIILLMIVIVKKDFRSQKIFLKYFLVLICVGFFLFNQYDELVSTRLSGDTRLERKSNIERLESFEISERLIKDNWLLGVGVGNYTLAVKKEIYPKEESWFYQPVHNAFLLILSEIGILGTLCISLVFFYVLYNLIQKRAGKRVFFGAILVSLGVMFMIDHWWWSLHFGILFLFLILGIILREERQEI